MSNRRQATRYQTLCCTLAALISATGCVGSGAVSNQLSGHIVGESERPIGPGLVMIERGKVHEGAYELGTLIGPDGRFTTQLPSGGTWGIHLFHDVYQYLPMEITVDDHQQVVLTNMMVAWGVWLDLTGLPTWPDQPADATLIRMPWDDNVNDNPTLSNIEMKYASDSLMEITADVDDPDGDLSRMILAHDPATGAGYAMNPPAPPDDQGNYPSGTYSLKVFLDERHRPGESKWYFVVSDNLCNNTPIIEVTMPPR